MRLQMAQNVRELALFNLAIDSNLRGCDLVQLKIRDVAHGDRIMKRTMVMPQKTHQPVQLKLPKTPANRLKLGLNKPV